MDQLKVLLAHGDARVRDAWAEELRRCGFAVEGAADAASVLGLAAARAPAFVVIDVDLPPLGGLDALAELKRACPVSPVVVVGPGAVAPVLEAFRAGAFDFVEAPATPARIAAAAKDAVERLRLGAERRRLAEELRLERARVRDLERKLATDDPFRAIVGGSGTVRGLLETLREVARTDATVLLTGESGTGKGLLARAIHDASGRRQGPFVEANCVVYSEGVLHSELFGHERGAFTGAARLKRGRFELASGGTIFLDEIGEIPPSTQLLLLRVLQERSFERVGGEDTVEVDVRLVAATNRDLHEAMRRGAFRTDLYYRLHVIPVHVPPLREHPEDIPLLAQHFIERGTPRLGRRVHGFTPAALEVLGRYPWPGNIRELENLVERLVVLSRAEWIDLADLPAALRGSLPEPAGAGTLHALERRRIVAVLEETAGNKKAAAARLGIHRSTLYAKLRRHGLLEATEPETAEAHAGTAFEPVG